jgi:hypothetical protein
MLLAPARKAGAGLTLSLARLVSTMSGFATPTVTRPEPAHWAELFLLLLSLPRAIAEDGWHSTSTVNPAREPIS